MELDPGSGWNICTIFRSVEWNSTKWNGTYVHITWESWNGMYAQVEGDVYESGVTTTLENFAYLH